MLNGNFRSCESVKCFWYFVGAVSPFHRLLQQELVKNVTTMKIRDAEIYRLSFWWKFMDGVKNWKSVDVWKNWKKETMETLEKLLNFSFVDSVHFSSLQLCKNVLFHQVTTILISFFSFKKIFSREKKKFSHINGKHQLDFSGCA